MAECRYFNSTLKPVVGQDYTYCSPDNYIVLTDIEFSSLTNYENYTGDFNCTDDYTYLSYLPISSAPVQEYPCGLTPSGQESFIVLNPVEYFTFFEEIEAGYAIQPGVFVMTQEQIDFILTAMLVMTMCVAFCLGFSANESSAK